MLSVDRRNFRSLATSRRRGARSYAFSFIELILVLAIIAITSAIAAPRFALAIQRQRLAAAAQRIASDLNMARSRANIASTPVTVTFTFASNQYQIAGFTDLNKPTSTYTCALSDDPYKAKLIGTTLGGVTQVTGTSQVTFSGFGIPSAGGTITIGIGNMVKGISIDAATGKAVVQ